MSGFITPPTPPGQSEFYAVNSYGEIGGAFLAAGTLTPEIAATWSPQGVFAQLPSLPGADQSSVHGLNDLGQAVGSSSFSGAGLPHAALWENGNVIDLTPGYVQSDVGAINNEGQVVGYYYDENNEDIPFIWDSVHGLIALPSYGLGGSADDINNQEQIVGSSFDPSSPSTPFAAIWEDGVLYNLNDLLPEDSGWVLYSAIGINDSGQIIGWGSNKGQEEGFLLTPDGPDSIPEPPVMVLAVGFPLLFRLRLRRRD